MEKYSFSDIKQVCENIRDLRHTDDEFKNSLDALFAVCCVPRNEITSPLLRLFTYEEILLCILKDSQCIDHLKTSPFLSVKILRGLLSVSHRKDWKVIITLFKNTLQSEFEGKNEFLLDVWSQKELYDLPVELVEILVNHKPLLIEISLLSIYTDRKDNINLWKSDTYRVWIRWCSQSSKLFLLVTSFLNELLIVVKVKSAILQIIQNFISDVKTECEKNKKTLISLYPSQYQSFAALLSMESDINPIKKEILKKCMTLRSNPSVVLLLLSHFPFWVDAI